MEGYGTRYGSIGEIGQEKLNPNQRPAWEDTQAVEGHYGVGIKSKNIKKFATKLWIKGGKF